MPPDTSSTSERESPDGSASFVFVDPIGARLNLYRLAEEAKFPPGKLPSGENITPRMEAWRLAVNVITDEEVIILMSDLQAERRAASQPTIAASDMICRHACLLELGLETAERHGRLQFVGSTYEHRPAAVQEVATGRHVVLCDECRQTLWWVLRNDPKQIEIVRRGLQRDYEKRVGHG